MYKKRIISVWFSQLSVEHALRRARIPLDTAAAAVATMNNPHILASVTPAAEAQGLYVGMPLRQALAVFPALITRGADVAAEAKLLSQLRRAADKYSPWVADDGHSGLMIDATGCAHLFGGEAEMLDQIEQDYRAQGLTTRTGMADTVGGAWALARFAGQEAEQRRCGDDIDQEARATRSRSAKHRQWHRTLPPRADNRPFTAAKSIAPPGETSSALSQLPLAALRLPQSTVDELARLGIRTIGQLETLPRGEIRRRFDEETVKRLDQAVGHCFEPLSPAAPDPRFAVRLTLPEPVGLEDDIAAGLDRLLPELCQRLRNGNSVARRVRFELLRVDGKRETIRVELARPADTPERIRPLIMMKLEHADAGDGIDALRLEASLTEATPAGHPQSLLGCIDNAGQRTDIAALDDLIGRLGARIGLDAITRYHPADSHIPEKTFSVMAAAWSEPETEWQAPANWRPAFLFQPEIVYAPETPFPPQRFRWRRRQFRRVSASGPERIMPEWWLDDPNWRNGTRDYWRVETECGTRLWLFFTYGGPQASKGWFCHGDFG
ncbi:MAG: DNA polymerase Y family protein [Rhodobacteraceae bacterium]|nr:DNA polymerase Y family protein [Paracoccaceae bacterium]